MRIITNSFFLALLVFAANLSVASGVSVSPKDTVTSDYTVVDRIISQKMKVYGVSKILVVLDIDNTVLTTDTDLGGDIWYSWQRGKYDVKPKEEQKVKCLFNDAICLLYELNTMRLTDENLPGFIKKWQQAGITVIALTSRDPRVRSATERELIKNKIDFTVTGLRRAGEVLPVYRDSVPKEYSYMKGIMMTGGQDKGVMLKYLIEKTGRTFQSIVFVDDSEGNISAMKGSYSNEPLVDLTDVLYDKILSERKKANGGPVLTQAQADKMASDWNELNALLNRLFPGRTRTECVSPF